MGKPEIMKIVFFLLRMGPAIIFVLFMMLLFFSFRVEVRENAMERFIFELSDTLATDENLVAHRSVFDPRKVSEAEKQDTNRNIELYAQNCDFGYYVNIESLSGQTSCTNDNDCASFCSSVCGGEVDTSFNGNCDCGGIFEGSCQCKKFDEWQDNYGWSYGYRPTTRGNIIQASNTFPVGILANVPEETVLPASMTITAYDSFLTRVSCITKKAYELKEQSAFKFNFGEIPGTTFKRTDPGGTHVCIYSGDEAVECRYLPDVPFEPLDIFNVIVSSQLEKTRGTIAAYPVKRIASCEEIKSDSSLITDKDGEVVTVVLCGEIDKK